MTIQLLLQSAAVSYKLQIQFNNLSEITIVFKDYAFCTASYDQ